MVVAGIESEVVEEENGVARVSDWEKEMRERRASDWEGIGRAPSNSDAMAGASQRNG